MVYNFSLSAKNASTITPAKKFNKKKDPTIINNTKYRATPSLLFYYGFKSIPLLSIPTDIIVTHPSVVDMTNNYIIALRTLSKL